MVRAVVFDFGQTLVDSAQGFRTAEKQLQARLLAELPSVSPETFLASYRRQRTAFQQRSDFSRRALCRAVLEHFGAPVDGVALQGWETEYWETVRIRTREFPEARDVLKRLRLSFRLGLVTNTQGQAAPGTHRLGDFPALIQLLDTVVVAGEAGVPEKPDPRPFQLCLARLDCRPCRALFVGDDPRIDVRGARDAGLKAVWLQHRQTRRNWPSAAVDCPIIGSLQELWRLPFIQETVP